MWSNKEVKTKVFVCDLKIKALEEVFDKIDSKETEQNIYKMAKMRQAKTNEIRVVKCIKAKDKNILV